MILYQNTAAGFQQDVENNRIADELEAAFIDKLHHRPAPNEKRSWENSLYRMETILRKAGVPDDCGTLIEYNIPGSGKRIDFLITGHDKAQNKNFIIVELKQWEDAMATDLQHTVKTFLNGGYHDVAHPSYQASSYKQFFRDMTTCVEENGLHPYSCAYLHNYARRTSEPLLDPQYADIVKDTPVFLKEDTQKFEDYVAEKVGQGDGMPIVDEITGSKTRPTRKFIDYVSQIYEGNPVYTMLDEQQIAYANIMKYAANATKRTTIIVNGGPGTGKSVVAMNAFIALFKLYRDQDKDGGILFVAPNASFRTAMIDILAKHKSDTKTRLKQIFSGSGSFYDAESESYDVLIVDEAHRLKSKGTYMYRGESQVADIVRASRVNIFFVDDNQQIRPDDEGSRDYIKACARQHHSEIIEVELKAQFRCSGAEGYLNWLDHTLQLADTANFDGWDDGAFEFKLMDTPQELEHYVEDKNAQGFKARMLAGYAWKWTPEKENPDANVPDVDIPEFGFARPWNSRHDQYSWAINDSGQHQVGCIHTSQGLEFDYIGVIIGRDLQYDPETHELVGDYNNYYDSTGKKGLKDNPDRLTKYIKDIYRVLLSRGMKGCAVFCCDENLRAYFKKCFQK